MPLSRDDYEELVRVATSARLADKRDLLMHWLPDAFVTSLATQSDPLSTLRSDLYHLFTTPELTGQKDPPLAVWLRNAANLRAAFPDREVFERLRRRLLGIDQAPAERHLDAARAESARSATVGGQRRTEDTMLAACPPPVRALVEKVLDEALGRPVYLYWGAKGFSLSAQTGSHAVDRNLLLARFFPPGTQTLPYASFDAYVDRSRLDRRQVLELREAYSQSAPFESRGDHTLHLPLTEGNLEAAARAVAVLWAVEEKLRSST